jgi:amino-acid N-acetyltransferase
VPREARHARPGEYFRTPDARGCRRAAGSAGLPTRDLTETHCEDFFFVGSAHAPTGLVGLELFGDVGLLRSLVVAPQRRGRGDGLALVKHAEAQARSRGVGALYLLTTTAEDFFTRQGYRRAERAAAPAAIRTTREFAGLCPASSAFMSKGLGREVP